MAKNILLLAMSTLGNIEKDNYYRYKDNEVFSGKSQLEPITRMLCEERRKQGEKLDRIIILETEATRKESKDGRLTAVEFYKERVKEFIGNVDCGHFYTDIEIDEDDPAEGIKEATSVILHDYKEQKKKNGEIKLWIDTQGGFRDVVMVLNAIISLLREQGIEPEGIYSVKYAHNNTWDNPCPIIDQTKKYGIFKFVSAMQEFMDFGKATGLERYYGRENRIVKCIGRIADAIQMCQPQKFEESIKEFADYLKSGLYEKEEPYLQIFVEFMKSDYGILLEQPYNTIEQIKWCVRKEFYQQAMTIYIEKIPKYYFEHGMERPRVEMQYGKNPDADAFYEGKFKELLRDEDDEAFQEILEQARAIADEGKDNGRGVKGYLTSKKKDKHLSDKVTGAITRLTEYLDREYDRYGNIKGRSTGKPTTIGKYIHTIRENSAERYCFLYGKKQEKLGTYGKKIKAVQKAKKVEPELAEKMKYYLAVKLLRNRMNHASEAKIEKDEKKAIEFLKGENIEIGIENEKIKKILTDGVRCVE